MRAAQLDASAVARVHDAVEAAIAMEGGEPPVGTKLPPPLVASFLAVLEGWFSCSDPRKPSARGPSEQRDWLGCAGVPKR